MFKEEKVNKKYFYLRILYVILIEFFDGGILIFLNFEINDN